MVLAERTSREGLDVCFVREGNSTVWLEWLRIELCYVDNLGIWDSGILGFWDSGLFYRLAEME